MSLTLPPKSYMNGTWTLVRPCRGSKGSTNSRSCANMVAPPYALDDSAWPRGATVLVSSLHLLSCDLEVGVGRLGLAAD
jgi:hypothetical protein